MTDLSEFTDGSRLNAQVPDFLGSPGNRLTDEQLCAVFRSAARGLLSDERIEALLTTAWTLEQASSLQPLMTLARFD